jgi:hypothetical protein
VLDAATAVEVTVTPLVRQRVSRSLGPAAADLLVPEPQQVFTKVATLRALGVTLPPKLQDDLFDIRNGVIHRGYMPSLDEARSALALATTVVTDHVPLR